MSAELITILIICLALAVLIPEPDKTISMDKKKFIEWCKKYRGHK